MYVPLHSRAVLNSASDGPTSRSDDWTFHWPVRVYYEDTDAGGIVYYANFLKFFERCRTEWLRALGVEQRLLAHEHGVSFVVAQLSVDYMRPARLDDALTIRARIARLANSFLVFEQDAVFAPPAAHEAARPARQAAQTQPAAQAAGPADPPLARATVKVACVDRERGTPARLPEFLVDVLRSAQASAR